ncbi:SMI1/KNR4 family protein [Nocardioides sp. CCNWLW239]|uniref:SMI1/KNR4 family protein n=1 Tax=Nocardioides sp. CCNWLW239 TaxID=3128902 RepID=UPI0030163D69
MLDWQQVTERLERLRANDSEFKVFGARTRGTGHTWLLAPTLSADEVEEAEAQLRIRFPEDYRAFLLEVGAGGAGPGYGLPALSKEPDGWRWVNDGGDTQLGLLDVAALSHEQIEQEWEEHEAREPRRGDFQLHSAFNEAYGSWRAADDALYHRQFIGSIPLSHQGCGWYEWLVVTGPERGSIRVIGDGCFPVADSFSDYYLEWLDKAEAELLRKYAGDEESSTQPRDTALARLLGWLTK